MKHNPGYLNEDDVGAISKLMKSHPYIKALRKEFGIKWYHDLLHKIKNLIPHTWKFTFRCGAGYYGLDYQKCFNRDNKIISFLYASKKTRRIRQWMSRKEIEWGGLL